MAAVAAAAAPRAGGAAPPLPELVHAKGVWLTDAAGRRYLDDIIVPHQANGVLVRECLGSLGFDDSRVHFTRRPVREHRRGVGCGDARRRGAVRAPARRRPRAAAGLGGGMTWGSVVLRWRAK